MFSHLELEFVITKSENVTRTKNHPLLPNVCRYTFVQFFVKESLFLYDIDPVSHFIFLIITSSLIEFYVLYEARWVEK
jgi:hypothetical protein